MDASIAVQAVALKQVQIQTTAQFAILKKQNEMDQMLIDMVANLAQSAPVPAGQGAQVDKYA